MFGRQPRLPVDIAFGLPVQRGGVKSHSQYVKHLKARLEESYQIVAKNSQKVAERNKRRFDKVVRESTLQEGDHVLVRNLRLKGKHKLADKWESTVFKVLSKMGDLPVYKVQPINDAGPTRTLHRDHLLPCGDLNEGEEAEQVEPKISRPRTRASQPQLQEPDSESEDGSCDCPIQLSSLPEKRFTHTYEIPKDHVSLVTPVLEGMGGNPLESGPELDMGVSAEQASLSQDIVRPDVTERPLVDPTTDVFPTCTGSPENGEALDGNRPTNKKPTGDRADQSKNKENEHDSEILANDSTDKRDDNHDCDIETSHSDTTVRRSERLRQPPKRFRYDQLGKPLISFAQCLLDSFNNALDTLSDYDSFSVVPRTQHEGTHADSRREGVTHVESQDIRLIHVV
uniref:Uncharacterized protein n=1 Tax=Nothobranchius rachovii TaxID=451742 RepID=A0A1A8SAI9_9TELE